MLKRKIGVPFPAFAYIFCPTLNSKPAKGCQLNLGRIGWCLQRKSRLMLRFDLRFSKKKWVWLIHQTRLL